MDQRTPPASTYPVALTYYCVIPHLNEARVLLVPVEGNWTLPWWSYEGENRPFWQVVEGVGHALLERFALDMATLRCIYVGHDPQSDRSEYMYEIAPAPSGWVPPPGGRWFGRDEIEHLALSVPTHRALLDQWFVESANASALAQRPPWYQAGWSAEVTTWIDIQLAHRNLIADAPPERLRSWERSCLLRVSTAGEYVYFKAVPKIFAHELPLTALLAQRYVGSSPTILARDDDRGWMLMEDFGGVGLNHLYAVEQWVAAIRRYAEIQIDCIPRTAALHELGCPRRPVATLPAGLEALLEGSRTLLTDAPGGLTKAEIGKLHTLVPDLKKCCADMAHTTIPETLEHGDFWAGNIAATTGGYLYFDWSDSALTHPFFSLTLFLEDAARAFPDDPHIEIRLRDAYLKPWLAYARREELERIFALAQRVAPLYHAVTYHRAILPALSARWEMAPMVPFYLRMLLGRGPLSER
ncbi:MAG TPA: hypothetical protein VIL85_08105 [Thermomicrobiales bacterium]|jgi:hypothetical protein